MRYLREVLQRDALPHNVDSWNPIISRSIHQPKPHPNEFAIRRAINNVHERLTRACGLRVALVELDAFGDLSSTSRIGHDRIVEEAEICAKAVLILFAFNVTAIDARKIRLESMSTQAGEKESAMGSPDAEQWPSPCADQLR